MKQNKSVLLVFSFISFFVSLPACNAMRSIAGR